MNFGFNSNVRTADALYHVQTEDRGLEHPFIDTIVYQGGRVVHKRSTSYQDLTAKGGDPKQLADLVRARLSEQHKDVIAQVEAGSLDEYSAEPVDSVVDTAALESRLTVDLVNPASWLTSSAVCLQIKVKYGDEASAGAEVEAFFESTDGRSKPARGKTNTEGFAEVQFPMPPSLGDEAKLVIRAMSEDDRGELRFRVKPAKSSSVPTTPAV